MGYKITVLGTGLVGTAMAIDLSTDYKVSAVDLNTDSFSLLRQHNIETQQADLSVPGEIATQVADSDLVIGALLVIWVIRP